MATQNELDKYLESGASLDKNYTFGKNELHAQIASIDDLRKELEKEKIARAKTVSEYEMRIVDQQKQYEAKMASRLMEERAKIHQELKQLFEGEEAARLRKIIAAKEEQIKTQLKASLYEQLKKEIYSQECSKVYEELRTQLTAEIKEQCEHEYKKQLDLEIEKMQDEARREIEENTDKIKEEIESKLAKHVDRINAEVLAKTEREKEKLKEDYLKYFL